MSGRVTKSRHRKSEQSASLWLAVLDRCSEMPACSACEDRRIPCLASEEDSSRCAECIRNKRGNCDLQGLTPAQMQKITRQHSLLEAQLDEAEEAAMEANAKVSRLRKQRRLWAGKMARAIRRGLDTIDELDRLEKEEAEAERARVAVDIQTVVAEESVAATADPGFEGFDWNSVDVGNAVVDWSGFLNEEASTGVSAGGSNSGAGNTGSS